MALTGKVGKLEDRISPRAPAGDAPRYRSGFGIEVVQLADGRWRIDGDPHYPAVTGRIINDESEMEPIRDELDRLYGPAMPGTIQEFWMELPPPPRRPPERMERIQTHDD